MSYLAQESLRIPQAELEDVAEEEDLAHLLPELIRMDGEINPCAPFELSASLNHAHEPVRDLMLSCGIKASVCYSFTNTFRIFHISYFQAIALT